MQEQQPYQPNAELVFRLAMSLLDDASGLLKLYFTVGTGAVVLFINLLVQSHTSRLVSLPLFLSILAFGAEAVLCLRLLLELARVRQILLNATSTGEAPETVKKQTDEWSERARKHGQWLERLFWTGMALGAIFMAAVMLGR